MQHFETPRLIVRPVADDDLEELLGVYLSNPSYLELTEGSDGEPGRYDLGMLERDVAVARITPCRELAAVCLKENGELLGVLDWLEANPSDGKTWVGLVMIRAHRQRQGFATEALQGLTAQLGARGLDAVRAAVIERNRGGRAFAEQLGFRAVSTTSMRLDSEEQVVVLELR